MKYIKLTSLNGKKIYVNIDEIGHFYDTPDGGKQTEKQTIVGVTTHNNGGFRVTETSEQIYDMIQECINPTIK
jgi:uncharacterized protein YlzI (FlbEa/FlbD family)